MDKKDERPWFHYRTRRRSFNDTMLFSNSVALREVKNIISGPDMAKAKLAAQRQVNEWILAFGVAQGAYVVIPGERYLELLLDAFEARLS
jgi:hypothetical protein